MKSISNELFHVYSVLIPRKIAQGRADLLGYFMLVATTLAVSEGWYGRCFSMVLSFFKKINKLSIILLSFRNSLFLSLNWKVQNSVLAGPESNYAFE